jgi:phosphatidylinositol glycan class H protein
MLTTQPRLRTRRPSPTTAEYTVSTLPTITLPLRLLFLTIILLRMLIGLSVVLLLCSKLAPFAQLTDIPRYTTVPDFFTEEYLWYTVSYIVSSSLANLSSTIASKVPLIILLPSSLTILYLVFLRIHTTESLLVLRGLGIQTSTSSETYLTTAMTRFIPTEKIQDILVNEAFRGFEVRYYLVVVVEGEEDVVVVFPKLLPRRVIVESVWRGVRGCLFEPDGDKGKDGGKG